MILEVFFKFVLDIIDQNLGISKIFSKKYFKLW